jgi:proteasome lid subunit RPN8/RPN11
MLKIGRQQWEQLRRHGEETYPHECCGVLLGEPRGGARAVRDAVRCANSRSDSPQNRYEIEPGELVGLLREARGRELEIVGFYHSHPDHPAHWSATDLEEAYWLGCSYVITSVEQGRATQTNAFLLTGDALAEKHFEDEVVEVE